MKKYIVGTIKFILFLSLGLLLTWFSVKNLTPTEIDGIKKSLMDANYKWVILSMIAGIFSHFSRAIRWKILLKTLGKNPSLKNTFYAVMIGYLGNLALPRLGEVLRCGILKRYEKIPLAESFGTVIAERVIDLLVLLILFVVSIALQFTRMRTYLTENILLPLQLKLLSIVGNKIQLLATSLIIVLGLVLFFVFRKKILQNPIVQKIKAIVLNFWEGIKTVGNIEKPFQFIFHSIVIWLMYLLTVYFCVFAFKETQSMTLSDCLIILTFGSFGVIATPGGIGAYQWIVIQILVLWGYNTATGVAFGWVVWLAQTAVVLLVGLLSFGLLAINNKEK